MCGVIKSPPAGAIASTQLCGVAKLNAHGCCVVLLSPEFPDPDTARVTSSLSGNGSCPYTPFTVAYHLTPLGAAMPQLHISTEVTRFSTSVWKSMGASVEAVSDLNGSTSGSKKANRAVESKPSILTNSSKKKKSAATHFSSDTAEQSKADREHEMEQTILKNYWAKNKISSMSSFGRGAHAQGSIPRSVSTGNIPAFYSSPLRNAKSTGSFINMHNDRLIDGPLPLLGRLGSLSTAAICQLGRDESDTEAEEFSAEEHFPAGQSSTVGSPTSRTSSESSSHFPHQTSDTTSNGSHSVCSSSSSGRHSSSHSMRGKGGIIPLCFTISGGVPSGRISWMVTSIPKEANFSSSNDGTDAYANSEGFSDGAAGAAVGTKDWRAL